jgi:Tol biopolymer transport system component
MRNFVLLALFSSGSLLAQNGAGVFQRGQDIGNLKNPGSIVYNPITEKYTIKASGTNLWANSDEFYFVWKKTSGDFILYANLQFIGKGVDPHRKVGLMIRRTLEPNSAYADVAIHGDGLSSLQYRTKDGNITEEIKSVQAHFNIVQLQKEGNTITVKAAHTGEPLQLIGKIDIEYGADEFYVGLFGCSHNADVTEEFELTNVRYTIPAAANFVPYKDYIGSKMEILDVQTGLRKVIYESKVSFEAPNWTHDGKFLIYNSKGKLYRISVDGGQPEEINTGFATANNNDHGLSFDGKMLAISHHAADREGKSTVYILPVSGGEPKVITDKSPSYWHGWSPDGKYLIYTGERDGVFDIYRKPVAGGSEVRLTSTPGLDDGSEYSPDGKYIYFNSNRTGTMQIWRMNADGSNQQQITFDDYNDWFPHISPDGKSIIFISYPNTVASGDHPYYKHVMLRYLPLNGGSIRVLAHIYGGQGTFNVPSWSPDGKKVAFVSCSD